MPFSFNSPSPPPSPSPTKPGSSSDSTGSSPAETPPPPPTQAELEAASPLNEVNPRAIDILMERIDSNLVQGMPREINLRDVDEVAAYLRDQRHLFAKLQQENIKPSRAKLKNPPKNLSEALKDLEF